MAKHTDPDLWRTSWRERAKNHGYQSAISKSFCCRSYTVNQDLGENSTIGLLDTSRLGEHPAPPVGADTDIVNQDSRENRTMGLLDASTLGEQLIPPIEADTDTVN